MYLMQLHDKGLVSDHGLLSAVAAIPDDENNTAYTAFGGPAYLDKADHYMRCHDKQIISNEELLSALAPLLPIIEKHEPDKAVRIYMSLHDKQVIGDDQLAAKIGLNSELRRTK
jgi:hypothetical protein